jgi:Holliday junction resolvase RusA-like endonuclease
MTTNAPAVVRRVVVPCVPDSVLSPNRQARHGYWAKRQARAELQRAAWAAALDAREELPLAGKLKVRACVLWPKGIPRKDLDNLGAMLKGCFDGFTDAGYWQDDRQIVELTLTQGRLDKRGNVEWPGGCITVEIEEAG